MPGSYYAGKGASVSIGATSAWTAKEWQLEIDTDAVDTTNMTSQGFRENISGLTKAQITVRGPYFAGGSPITSGTVYTFGLNVGGGIGFSVPGRVTKLRPSTDVEGVAQLEVSAESTGVFTASVT